MLIYSKSIQIFLGQVRTLIRDILSREMHINVQRQRFEFNGLLYPINPVVFEDPKKLGYFEAHSYQIGINKNLIGRSSHEFLKNLLRHELCHFYMHINASKASAHGKEFKQQCRVFGWGEEVSAATSETTAQALLAGAANSQEAKILQKVKKLLSLTQSSNQFEAEMATAKANQLIMEHNLQIEHETSIDEEQAFVARVLHANRNNQKLKSIYEILKLFMVQPVFSYGNGSVYLEVIGEKIHVEMADYIAKYLDREMELLWKVAKANNPKLKGARSKNSFFVGLSKGFCQKIHAQRNVVNIGAKEVISLEKKLERQVTLVYSRLSSTNSQGPQRCSASMGEGQRFGASMNIRKGLNQNFKNKLLNY